MRCTNFVSSPQEFSGARLLRLQGRYGEIEYLRKVKGACCAVCMYFMVVSSVVLY